MANYVIQVVATCAKDRTLARASSGRLWAGFAWASEVQVAYSDDGGATWVLEQVSNSGVLGTLQPTIAIDSGDNLHVVWRQDVAPPDYHIYYRRRSSLGVWDPIEMVSVNVGEQRRPTIAIDSNDDIHVVWLSTSDPVAPFVDTLKYRMKQGGVWQAIDVLDSVPWLDQLWHPCMAIGSDDVVHVVWTGEGYGTFPAQWNLRYRQKTIGGWQPREDVTDVNAAQQLPSIALDSNDDVHIAWFGRGWGINLGVWNVRYIMRTAGVWGVSEAVTDVATDQSFGDSAVYLTIALDTADNIYVVWSGEGWGVNALDRNVQLRRKIGPAWQAQQGLTDRTTDQDSVSLIWAMHPTVSGIRTNIPLTNYAFLLCGDAFGVNQVEYWTQAGWSPVPPPPVPPVPAVDAVVTTLPATNITEHSARLNGVVASDGGSMGSVRFQWGMTTAYGMETSWLDGYRTGNSFSADLPSLAEGVAYHFRAVFKSNPIAYGQDMSFSTLVPEGPVTFVSEEMLHLLEAV